MCSGTSAIFGTFSFSSLLCTPSTVDGAADGDFFTPFFFGFSLRFFFVATTFSVTDDDDAGNDGDAGDDGDDDDYDDRWRG